MNPRNDNDAETAARWLARRDRGLKPEEQEAFLKWMGESRERGETVAEIERAWTRLDTVRHRRPAHGTQPDPDLLAVPSTRRWWRLAAPIAAAAAVVALAVLLWPIRPDAPERGAQVLPAPERLVLEDGSVVELNAGAAVAAEFTPGERHVRLLRGEAHFDVAKDAGRPFVVAVDAYAVRAIGTAFLVRQDAAEVAVTVTEGTVHMSLGPGVAGGVPPPECLLAELRAGQQAVARADAAGAGTPRVSVRELSPLELDLAMAWRGIRLEFDDLPLDDVVKAFNRYNVRQLVVADPETGRIRVGGHFRADNLNAFVRLLDSGFDVVAEARGNEIVLRRR